MIRFDAGALRVTLQSMSTVLATERSAAVQCVDAAGRILRDMCRQNVSLGDHDLADLAREGHPYARRHGSIQIHRSGSAALVNPANRVHKQSGRLAGALRAGPTNNGLGYRVEFDMGAAPHAAYVVHGTRVMLPRDVLMDTAQAPEVQKRMMRAIVSVLGKKLRTKATTRFER